MMVTCTLTFWKISPCRANSFFAVKQLLSRYLLTLINLSLPLMIFSQSTTQYISLRTITEIPPVLKESSGALAISPNAIWSHNDGGNSNHLFCFDTLGNVVRTLQITNATNVDWEDLTSDKTGRIYIGDVGNNANTRKDLCIYRIPDPDQIPGSATQAEIIMFTLEDQLQFPPPSSQRNFDIEAIMWKDDTLFLFTKNRSTPQNGLCKMYKIPAQPGIHIARLVGSVYLGSTNSEARVTSADINHSTGEVLLLTHSKIVSFRNYPANNFFQGTRTDYYFSTQLTQPEGITWVDPDRVYITEEGPEKSNSGYLYEVKWAISNPIPERIRGSSIKVYPNPFTDRITLRNSPCVETCQVTDAGGKFIRSFSSNDDMTFDLSTLQPGMYFIWLKINNHPESILLIKQ